MGTINHIAQTSLLAYNDIKIELGARQIQVLEAFKTTNLGLCDLELAEALKLPINSITPRRGELQTAGLVVWTGHKLNKWGRAVRQYTLTAKGDKI